MILLKYGTTVTNTWEADKTYTFNGVQMSGYNIIKDYYQNYYSKESANYITDAFYAARRSEVRATVAQLTGRISKIAAAAKGPSA